MADEKGIKIPIDVLNNTQAQFDATAKGLVGLQKTLSKLKEVTDATSGSVTGIKTAFSGLKAIRLPAGFDSFVAGMKEFSTLSATKITNVATALSSIGTVTKLPTISKEFTNNLKTISSVEISTGKVKNLTEFLSALTALGTVGSIPSLGAMVTSLEKLSAIQLPSLTPIVVELQKLTTAFTATASASAALNTALPDSNARLGALNANVSVATQTQQAGGAAIQNTTGVVKEQATAWERLADKIRQYARYRAISSVIISIQNTLEQVIPTIAGYDQALADLQAITQSSATAMVDMGIAIKAVSSKTKFSSSEVASGAKMLAQTGLSAKDTILALQGVSDLATGTLTEMSTAVDLVTTAMFTFGMRASESAKIADIFTNAANLSKLDMDKLRTGMNYVGPVAADLGLSLQETATAMSVLSNAGLRASTMGTSLREVLGEIAAPSEKFTAAIAAAGLSMEDLNPATHNFSQLLDSLRVVVKDTGDAFDLFGKRGASGALALLNTGGEGGYDALYSKIDQVGSAAKAAQVQMGGLQNAWKNFISLAGNLSISMGEAGLIGAMRGVVNGLASVLKGMITLTENQFLQWVVKVTVLVGGLAIAFNGIPLVFGGIVTGLVMFTGVLAGMPVPATAAAASLTELGAAGLFAQMGLWPLTLTIAAVAAVMGGLIYVSGEYFKSAAQLNKQFVETKSEIDAQKSSIIGYDSELKKLGASGGTLEETMGFMERFAAAFPSMSADIYATGGDLTQLGSVIEIFKKKLSTKELDNYVVGLQAVGKTLRELAATKQYIATQKSGIKETDTPEYVKKVKSDETQNNQAIEAELQANADKLLKYAESKGIELSEMSSEQRDTLLKETGLDLQRWYSSSNKMSAAIEDSFIALAIKVKEGKDEIAKQYTVGDASLIQHWQKTLEQDNNVLKNIYDDRNTDAIAGVSGFVSSISKGAKAEAKAYLDKQQALIDILKTENDAYATADQSNVDVRREHNEMVSELGNQAVALETSMLKDKDFVRQRDLQRLKDNFAADLIVRTKGLTDLRAINAAKLQLENEYANKVQLVNTIGLNPEKYLEDLKQNIQNVEAIQKEKRNKLQIDIARDGEDRHNEMANLAADDAARYREMYANAVAYLAKIKALAPGQVDEKIVKKAEDLVNNLQGKTGDADLKAEQERNRQREQTLNDYYTEQKADIVKGERTKIAALQAEVAAGTKSLKQQENEAYNIKKGSYAAMVALDKKMLDKATKAGLSGESTYIKEQKNRITQSETAEQDYLNGKVQHNLEAYQAITDTIVKNNKDSEKEDRQHQFTLLTERKKAGQDTVDAQEAYAKKVNDTIIESGRRAQTLEREHNVKLRKLADERTIIDQKAAVDYATSQNELSQKLEDIDNRRYTSGTMEVVNKLQAEKKLAEARAAMAFALETQDAAAYKRAEELGTQAESIFSSLPSSEEAKAGLTQVQVFQRDFYKAGIELADADAERKRREVEISYAFEGVKQDERHKQALYNALSEKVNKLESIEETFLASMGNEKLRHENAVQNIKYEAELTGKTLKEVVEEQKNLIGKEGAAPTPSVEYAPIDSQFSPQSLSKMEEQLKTLPGPLGGGTTETSATITESPTLRAERIKLGLAKDELLKVQDTLETMDVSSPEKVKASTEAVDKLLGSMKKANEEYDKRKNDPGVVSGWDQMAKVFGDEAQQVSTSIQAAAQNSLATFFSDIVIESKDAIDSLQAFGASFAKTCANIILQILAVKAVKAAGVGLGTFFSEGGLVTSPISKAGGGYISGPGTGTSDSIPARLSNGEYVMTAKSTAEWLPVLEIMRQGKFKDWLSGRQFGSVKPSIPSVSRFADGGLVKSTLSESSDKNAGANNVNMVFNISDSGVASAPVAGGGAPPNIKQLGAILSNMVTVQIMKEKRPGGLLYG